MSVQYIYGVHAVKAALLAPNTRVEQLYIVLHSENRRLYELVELAERFGIPVMPVSSLQLAQRLPAQARHQGVAAACSPFTPMGEDVLKKICNNLSPNALFLILDGVQDPQNLGACLRTANAMGVTAVIAPKDRAAHLSAAVIKVASGAAAVTSFISVTNLSRTMEQLQQAGIWLYGADMEASTAVWQTDMHGRVGIVVGSEDKGLRTLTRQHCDQLVKIPQYGEVSSLNVATAAAICLYEVRRQQHLTKI